MEYDKDKVDEVLLERRAERDLKKLSAKAYYRIIPYLKGLCENPVNPVQYLKTLFFSPFTKFNPISLTFTQF